MDSSAYYGKNLPQVCKPHKYDNQPEAVQPWENPVQSPVNQVSVKNVEDWLLMPWRHHHGRQVSIFQRVKVLMSQVPVLQFCKFDRSPVVKAIVSCSHGEE